MNRRAILACAIVFLLFHLPEKLQAATVTWNLAGGGSWNNSGNWSPAQVPTIADDVVFPAGFAGGIITLDASQVANSISCQASGSVSIVDASFGLTLGSGGISSSVDFTLNAPLTLSADMTLAGMTHTTISGVISGTQNINISGSGHYSLSGINTFTGNVTLTAGTMDLSAATDLGSPVTNALVMNGGTLNFTQNITLPHNITLAATGYFGIGGFSGSTLRLTGVISGPGTFFDNGADPIVLNGNNTYTGGTVVSNGAELDINSDAALGAVPGSPTPGSLVMNSGNIGTDGVLNITINPNRGMTVQGDGTLFSLLSGASITYNGNIDGSGGVGMDAAGATVSLGGTNSFSGPFQVINGMMLVTSSGAIPSTSRADVSGILQFTSTATAPACDGLQYSGNVILDPATTLTIATDGGPWQFDGIISGGGNIVVSGPSTEIFTGPNAYSGTTTVIGGGRLSIGSDANLGSAPAVPTPGSIVLSGGILEANMNFTLNSNRGIALTGGGISVDAGFTMIYAGVMSGSNFTSTGAGVLELGNVNTYSGNTIVNAGTLQCDVSETLPPVSLAVSPAAHVIFSAAVTSQTVGSLSGGGSISAVGTMTLTTGLDNTSTTYSGPLIGNMSLVKTGAGTLTLGCCNAYSGTTNVINGTLQLGAVNALPVSTILVLGNAANAGVLEMAGFSQTVAGLTNNSALANTVSNNGTLATFAVNLLADQTYDGVITGSFLNFVKDGPSTLTLSNPANNWGGSTLIVSGTLQLGANNALPTNTMLSIGYADNNCTFDLNGFNQSLFSLINSSAGNNQVTNSTAVSSVLTVTANGSYDGQINGTNLGFTKTGPLPFALAGTNSYAGPTTVSGFLSVTGSIANSTTTVTSSGILQGTGTLGPIITQAGSVIQPGPYGQMFAASADFSLGGTFTLAISSNANIDSLSLTGVATLGSNELLQIDLNGYSAALPPAIHPVLNATTVTGQFINPPQVLNNSSGKTVLPMYGPNSVAITIDAPPVVLLNNPMPDSASTFTAGNGAISVLGNATLTDADDAGIDKVTVTNVLPQDGANEILSATPSGMIVAGDITYSNNVLTIFHPNAPIADFQAVLNSLQYNNLASSPNTSPRSIQVVADDGRIPGQPAYATITVQLAPVITSAPNALILAGQQFNYVITATDNPTSFSAFGLPGSVTLDTVTGQFSGTVTAAGVYTFTINAMGPAGTASEVLTLTVNAGNAASIIVSSFPSPVNAGMSSGFLVQVVDAFGNAASGYNGMVSFSSTDPAATFPPSYGFTAVDSSVHPFIGTLNTAGVQSIIVKDSGGLTGSQTGIVVNPGAVTKLNAAGFPLATIAGQPGNLTVTAQDAAGNTNSTYSGTVTIASTDPQFVPANYTFLPADNGVHTFNLALNTAGIFGISVVDNNTPLIKGGENGIVVNAAPATTLIVAGFPASITAGIQGTFSVTAKDSFGNIDKNFSDTVNFTTTDPGVALSSYTFQTADSGTKTFGVIFKTPGLQSLTATDAIKPTVTGSQTGIGVIIPKPVITSSLSASAAVGTAFTYTITANNSPTSFSALGVPAGLSLNAATGVISGVPVNPGTGNVTIGATNASGTTTAQLTIVTTPPPVIVSPLLASTQVGSPFSYTLSATGQGPITFSSPALPPGLIIVGNMITGTPTQAGVYNVKITASNGLSPDDVEVLSIVIAGVPVSIQSPLTATGKIGIFFNYTISATGSAPIVYGASGLPPGLVFSGASISGVPTIAGSNISVTLTATDGNNLTDTKTLNLNILSKTANLPPVISSIAADSPAVSGAVVNFSVNATDPQNLDLTVTWDFGDGGSASGKSVSHTYSAAGNYTVKVSAADSSNTTTKSLPLTVFSFDPNAPIALNIDSSVNPVLVGQTETFTGNAVDPNGVALAYAWDFGDGSPVSSGNPIDHVYNSAGSYTVQVFVTNANGLNALPFQKQQFAITSQGTKNVNDPTQGGAPTLNPLNGLSIDVANSDNGVIVLNIDVNALVRDAYEVSTDFGLSGISAVAGTTPAVKYTDPGLFVATTVARLTTTKQPKGKARKTLSISRSEVGLPPLVDADPSDHTIHVTTLKGALALSAVGSGGALTQSSSPIDSISTSANIELPQGLDMSKSQSLQVAIGNIVDVVLLDPKGNGKGAKTAMKLKTKNPKGSAKSGKGQMAQITISTKDTNMVQNGFDTEGVSAQPKTTKLHIQVAISLAGISYTGLMPVDLKISTSNTTAQISGKVKP